MRPGTSRIRLALTIILCLYESGGISHAQRPTILTPLGGPIPATYFGMHNHEPLISKRTISIPIGTYRLWDADVNWPNLEPQRDQWTWDRLDGIIALARERGWQVILPLAFSPRWASARPDENSFDTPDRLGWSAEPANMEDWRNYVRTVASRYQGRVHIYELWNEPNSAMFFTGTIPQLVALAREAYSIVKAIDPASIVVSPSVVYASGAGLRHLNSYLSQGGGAWADVVGFHFYIAAEPPEALPARISQAQRVMKANGAGTKPLWNTEMTWASQDIQFSSTDQQAAYLARAYVLDWAAGVSQVDWYAWDNRIFPGIYMVEADLSTPAPPAAAYTAVREWLLGARMRSVTTDDVGNWTCTLARPDGTLGYILWNPNGPRPLSIPPEWQAIRIRDLAGGYADVPAAPLSVGISPVLVETSAMVTTRHDSGK